MRIGWMSSLAALLVANGLGRAQPTAFPTSNVARASVRSSDAEVLLPEPPGTSPYAPRAFHPIPTSLPAPTHLPDTTRPFQPIPGKNGTASAPSAPGGPGAAGCSCEQPAFAEPPGAAAHDRVWVEGEYLLWWLRGNHAPPLVGSLPASQAGTNLASLPAGAITTLFGDSAVREGAFSGGRLTAGVWLDEGQYFGLEGSFFALERRNLGFRATSPGDPVVGPLFFDVTAGLESIITPTNPAQAREVSTVTASERLWGTEANYRMHLVTFGNSPLDLLAGFRYLDLEDSLSITSSTNFLGSGTRTFNDLFNTRNKWYGGQFGASFDVREGPWSLRLVGKLGLGGVNQSVDINGFTTETPLGRVTRSFRGGILTAPSNIGHFSHTTFALLPEFDAKLGYQFTSTLRAFVGYSILHLEHTVYPGDAPDVVNPSNIRGLIVRNPAAIVRPLPNFREGGLWAQGLDFGLEWRY